MFLLNAPAQRIAMALNALPRNLAVTVSEAIKANKFGTDGGAAAPSPEAAQ
jgi:ribosomal protein L10